MSQKCATRRTPRSETGIPPVVASCHPRRVPLQLFVTCMPSTRACQCPYRSSARTLELFVPVECSCPSSARARRALVPVECPCTELFMPVECRGRSFSSSSRMLRVRLAPSDNFRGETRRVRRTCLRPRALRGSVRVWWGRYEESKARRRVALRRFVPSDTPVSSRGTLAPGAGLWSRRMGY